MHQRYSFYQHHRSSIKHLKTSARIIRSESHSHGSQVRIDFLASQQDVLEPVTTKCFLKGKKCNRYSNKLHLSFFLQSYSFDGSEKDKWKLMYLPIPSQNRFFFAGIPLSILKFSKDQHCPPKRHSLRKTKRKE